MARPRYVAQTQPNSCWAACLEMWMDGEIGAAWSQQQILNSAGDFTCGPGGIDIDALGSTIDRLLKSTTLSMEWRKVDTADKLPYVGLILNEVGNIYVAYRREQGGHANVIYDYNGKGYAALDPDPKVGARIKTHDTFFSAFPCFVGWRHTSAMFGTDYTGRPPWDYAPPA